ncbi:adenylosuccinate synthetase [Anaeramoeba ignava]|uniref:Adenylosuccinate synthetase n=1 Tax=Anaeramoeba ignava TaxID=1746090 RepID=A0A9Q0LZR1_ANAIG|nr:adenylosuccinate synthetase [Anaeramoeba ignava]
MKPILLKKGHKQFIPFQIKNQLLYKFASSITPDKDIIKENVVVVLGTQWGDEGKGKLIDQISNQFDFVARVQGGSNAGHTIKSGNHKFAMHLVPSGILNPKSQCVVGNGVVVHLPTMFDEIKSLEAGGIHWAKKNLKVSDRAHILFDFHQQVDGMQEGQRAEKDQIGTTKKGIGPCYSSKMNRENLRFCDLVDIHKDPKKREDFFAKFKLIAGNHMTRFPLLKVNLQEELEKYMNFSRIMSENNMISNTVHLINEAIDTKQKVLIECANATMLSIDFGTYPFVTSSNCDIGGVCTGLGVSPKCFKDSFVIGVTKCYCTRVGSGPFPTELFDETGEQLRKAGHEFGTTTGRPRRCGWIDTVALNYAVMINRIDAFILTKLDVLTGMKEIKIGYKYIYPDGSESTVDFPADLRKLENVKVAYKTFKGWNQDISKCKTFDSLPKEAQDLVLEIEKLTRCFIKYIGVGPDRSEIIIREKN